MINTTRFEQYRQGDTIQFLNNILEAIISPGTATTLKLLPQRTALGNVVDQLNTLWQPATGSELTPEIAALDKQRDSLFMGFKLTTEAWASHHYLPDWRNAAYIIADNIAGHGERIALMRYQQETATLNAIIHDLENEHADHVSTLGLEEWVSQLKAANQSFNEKYLQRNQATAGNNPGQIATLIQDATAAYRKLQSMFEARHAIAADESLVSLPQFITCAQEWNNLIKSYNDATITGGGSNPEPQT